MGSTRRIDSRYAELIGRGRDREAMALRADAAFTGIVRSLMAGALWLFGKVLLGKVDDTFRRDVVIEAQAEVAHHASEAFGRIAAAFLDKRFVHDVAEFTR